MEKKSTAKVDKTNADDPDQTDLKFLGLGLLFLCIRQKLYYYLGVHVPMDSANLIYKFTYSIGI